MGIKIVLGAPDGTPRWRGSNRKLVSVHLEIVLISTQDTFIVYAKRTIGSEIILGAHDCTPTDVGQVEAQFGPLGDSVNLDAR
jgi:hypothetical protein